MFKGVFHPFRSFTLLVAWLDMTYDVEGAVKPESHLFLTGIPMDPIYHAGEIGAHIYFTC